jgi:hypothetical protein
VASALYPKAKEQLLQSGINLATGNVKVVLVDVADYTYSAAHEFLTDVPSAARVSTTGNLTSKTFTNGTFDAADTTFVAAAGDPSEAMIVYVDTGTAATSRLVCYIDTVAGPAALSVIPNTGDIGVQWAAGGIFSL